MVSHEQGQRPLVVVIFITYERNFQQFNVYIKAFIFVILNYLILFNGFVHDLLISILQFIFACFAVGKHFVYVLLYIFLEVENC